MADQVLILQVRDNTTTRRDIGVQTGTLGDWAARVVDPDVLAEIQAVLAKLNAGLSVSAAITTGTLGNGIETAVSNVAISVLAANPARKAAIIQNVGSDDIRVGVAGVTATTGIRLRPNRSLVLSSPYIHTGDVFAIRETTDSIVLAQEIV